MHLDLNCDLGEGCAYDRELLALVTSANIACAFHAGDPASAGQALHWAAQHSVVVGAHPGYADRAHFGRRELELSEEQIFIDCVYQVGALVGLARAAGVTVRYLKPHGALYNQACRDEQYARPVVRAAQVFDLAVMGLPNSCLQRACGTATRFLKEGFADRKYRPDGSLVPRTSPDAFVHDPQAAVAQADWLLQQVGIDSLCVHGDNPAALAFVRALRTALLAQGVALQACL